MAQRHLPHLPGCTLHPRIALEQSGEEKLTYLLMDGYLSFMTQLSTQHSTATAGTEAVAILLQAEDRLLQVS